VVAAAAELAAAGVDRGAGDRERQVLDHVREEQRREALAEVEGDPGADAGEHPEHVAGPALAARDRVLQGPPAPLRARDRGAVEHGDEAAEPEHEGQDQVVRAGERDQGLGVVRAPAAVALDRGRGDQDQAEEPDEQPHRYERCRAADELAEPAEEDPHAAGSEGAAGGPAPMPCIRPSDESPPPVSSRKSSSRSVPDSSPDAKIPACASRRLTSAARLGSTWTVSHWPASASA